MRYLLACTAALSALSMSACASDSAGRGQVEDGWPARSAEQTYRCPDGTWLDDRTPPSGRRNVTCRGPEGGARGFELIWYAEGPLATLVELDASGRPSREERWYADGTRQALLEYEQGQVVRRKAWYSTGAERAAATFDPTTGETKTESRMPDDTVQASGVLRDGVKIGPWTEWRDGAREELTYEEGVPQGEATRFYPDGSREVGRYVDGQRAGEWLRDDPNGRPMLSTRWAEGRRHGLHRQWHPNGQLAEEGEYSRGEKNGVWKAWYPGGQLKARSRFACDVPVGRWSTWFSGGAKRSEGLYVRGARAGEWQEWNEQGIVVGVENFPVPEELAARMDDPKALQAWFDEAVPEVCEAP